VREMDTTAAVKIFAVVHQDRYISKPTGSTLNEPELRAFTTDPRPHAFGTKNVNLTVYSRAMVKVGPLARIRIDDEVYIRILPPGHQQKQSPNTGARANNTLHK